MYRYNMYSNLDSNNECYVTFAAGVNPVAITADVAHLTNPVWKLMDWAMVQYYGYNDDHASVIIGKVRELVDSENQFPNMTMDALMEMAYFIFTKMFGDDVFTFTSLPFDSSVSNMQVKNLYITIYANTLHRRFTTSRIVKKLRERAEVTYIDRQIRGDDLCIDYQCEKRGLFKTFSLGIDDNYLVKSGKTACVPFIELNREFVLRVDRDNSAKGGMFSTTVIGIEDRNKHYTDMMWNDRLTKVFRKGTEQYGFLGTDAMYIPSVFKIKPNAVKKVRMLQTWAHIDVTNTFKPTDGRNAYRLVSSEYHTVNVSTVFSILNRRQIVLF